MKKLFTLFLALVLLASMAACGKTDTPDNTGDNAENATYRVGVCQLAQHPALDAATQGFVDALKEALGDDVKIDVQNASGESNNCSTIINGFLSADVDLVMANATPALTAAASATSEAPILGTAVTAYGVALDLESLCTELKSITAKGVSVTPDNLKISDRASLVLPWHILLDELEETRLKDKKYGSTRQGIAPFYSDKYQKKTIQAGELFFPEHLTRHLADLL